MEHVSLCFRVKNSKALHRTFNVDPLYLQYDKKGIIDHYDSCNSLHTKLKEIVYPILQPNECLGYQYVITHKTKMC